MSDTDDEMEVPMDYEVEKKSVKPNKRAETVKRPEHDQGQPGFIYTYRFQIIIAILCVIIISLIGMLFMGKKKEVPKAEAKEVCNATGGTGPPASVVEAPKVVDAHPPASKPKTKPNAELAKDLAILEHDLSQEKREHVKPTPVSAPEPTPVSAPEPTPVQPVTNQAVVDAFDD